jgi:magnesium-transporting ATPase (P-type)
LRAGTLTENEMSFKTCSIGGRNAGLEFEAAVRFAQDLVRHEDGTAVMFMRVLAMCNNLTPMFRDRPAMHEHQLLRRQSIADSGMGVL